MYFDGQSWTGSLQLLRAPPCEIRKRVNIKDSQVYCVSVHCDAAKKDVECMAGIAAEILNRFNQNDKQICPHVLQNVQRRMRRGTLSSLSILPDGRNIKNASMVQEVCGSEKVVVVDCFFREAPVDAAVCES